VKIYYFFLSFLTLLSNNALNRPMLSCTSTSGSSFSKFEQQSTVTLSVKFAPSYSSECSAVSTCHFGKKCDEVMDLIQLDIGHRIYTVHSIREEILNSLTYVRTYVRDDQDYKTIKSTAFEMVRSESLGGGY